jgi:hypothetical protein
MRVELHMAFHAEDHAWCLERNGKAIAHFNTKADAITAGQIRGHTLESMGGETHLVVHRQDGSVEAEYSYGDAQQTVL